MPDKTCLNPSALSCCSPCPCCRTPSPLRRCSARLFAPNALGLSPAQHPRMLGARSRLPEQRSAFPCTLPLPCVGPGLSCLAARVRGGLCPQEPWLRGGSQLGLGVCAGPRHRPEKQVTAPKMPYASRNWARGRLPTPESQTPRSVSPVQNHSRNKPLDRAPAGRPLSHPLLLAGHQWPCRNPSEEPLAPRGPTGGCCKAGPCSPAAAAAEIPGKQRAWEQASQTPPRLAIGNGLNLILPALMTSELH